jgi:ubiquinone/menaquinone biosynthesis C-methylase UbiE
LATLVKVQNEAVNRAFSLQSSHYDEEDYANRVLADMRKQVYRHIDQYLGAGSNVLELNAGTGIDAQHLVSQGHHVHAIDIADGMIGEIEKKIARHNLGHAWSCQKLSYQNLDHIKRRKFDFVFSDFGGLNCIEHLDTVTRHLPALLQKGAHVTWVIMPPVCIWELMWVFKGYPAKAFRRLRKGGVKAHLEGEYFQTYYHSLSRIRSAFGPSFTLVQAEGLAALSPQPHHKDFPAHYPRFYSLLRAADRLVRNSYPFNRWADHIIVTFRYDP